MSAQSLSLKILGSGLSVPKRVVTDQELESRMALPAGWIGKTGGVLRRHFVTDETASGLGADAARQALDAAGCEPRDLDLILSGSGTQEQILPGSAIFVQRALGLGDSGIAAFDVNSTCLSFVTALDVAAHFLATGRYRKILIVSSEIASVGIDWSHRESATILGDGAAAVIVARAPEGEPCAVLGSLFRSYGSHAEACQIRGGGTRLYPTHFDRSDPKPFLFEMDGMSAFKFISQRIEGFLAELLEPLKMSLADLALVVPHQASKLSMDLVLRRRLALPESKLVDILPEYGNTIAASIPMALHRAIAGQRVQRGQKILLLGTSAGLSIGGTVLTY